MSTARDLAGAVERHREAALARHEEPLARAYSRNLRRIARLAAESFARHATSLDPQAVAAAADPPAQPPRFLMPDADEILSLERAQRELEKGTGSIRTRVVTGVAHGVAAELALSFDVTNPLLDGAISKLGTKITKVTESVRGDVMANLQDAYEEGLSIPNAARAVQRALVGSSSLRGRTIARTELIGAVNAGSLVAAQTWEAAEGETGKPLLKTWMSAQDERVRPTHDEADGQVVPLNEPFDVGGYWLDHPGDPDGPAEEIINCRCTMGYTDEAAQTAGGDMPRSRTASAATLAIPDSANYREAPNPDVACCELCVHFSGGQCDLYDAAVDPAYISDGFEAAADNTDAAAQGGAWEAVLCVEGIPTGDGRMLALNGGGWRPLPLTLMAMDSNPEGWDPGHGGAEVAGRIDEVTTHEGAAALAELQRFGVPTDELPADGLRVLSASGVFDTSEYAAQIERQVGQGYLRGVSIDPLVETVDYVLVDKETGEVTAEAEADPRDLEDAFWGESDQYQLVVVFNEYTITAATVCPMPALEQAVIRSLAASARRVRMLGMQKLDLPSGGVSVRLHGAMRLKRPLLASAVAPKLAAPPAAWFDVPEPDVLTPLTVTDDGQVFGHAAPWGECHIGQPSGRGVCVQAPRSASAYSFFHLGEVRCDDGTRVRCGQITMSTGHADLSAGWKPAADHYDNTGTCAADVVVSDGRLGIWCCGAVRPGLGADEMRELMGAKLSGDWRPLGAKGLEMVGLLAVNVPGFPVVAPRARVAAATGNVLALVAAGVVDDVPRPSIAQMAARALGHEAVLDGLAARAGLAS